MSEDPLALYSITSTMPSSDPSVLPSESDYEAICAAVMETLRGRWFLAEYARRNRHSDTKVVLSAIERIEAMIRGENVATPADRFRIELADMAKAIARTKSEIAAIKPEAEHPGKILEASEELDSIVHTTEKATSSILAAAEQVQEIAWTVREQDLAAPICDQLDALATDIYTACSFQDLTGQRIQKVIHVMRYLEERIDSMIDIWDEGVSAQAGPAPTAEAAPAAAAKTAPAAHHDVAQDDLDQTDVDMVMDPAQQDAAVKVAASTGRVVIDHEPLKSAEPMQSAAHALIPEAENLAPAGLANSFLADSFVLESFALEGLGSAGVAPESAAAPEMPDETSEEVPVFFRAMEPSGPVAEPAPAMAAHEPVVEPASPQATATQSETAPEPKTDLAPTIAAVREALFGAFPGLDLKANQAEEAREQSPKQSLAPASIGDDEPAAELYEPAPTASAPVVSELALPEQAVAAEPETALVAEPVVDEIEERATPTLVGPADFLLEPLPSVQEASSFESNTAEIAATSEPEVAEDADGPTMARAVAFDEPAEEIETVDIETLETEITKVEAAKVEIAEIEPETVAPVEAPEPAEATALVVETEAAVIETAAVNADEIAEIEAAELGAAEPEIATVGILSTPDTSDEAAAPLSVIAAETHEIEAAEAEPAQIEAVPTEAATTETSGIEIVAIDIAEREIVAIEAAEFTSEIDTTEVETTDNDAPVHLTAGPDTTTLAVAEPEIAEIEVAEPEVAVAETAEPETAAPELAAADTVAEIATETIDLEIVEIAEIEAVATAPVAPEPADEVAPEAAVETKTEEPESVAADTEAKEEAEEERPIGRTAMPDVTFASMAPIAMPMEYRRIEPAEERFAAAATATPTQGDFIPFGHSESDRPAASARPIVMAAPSIYSTSPYLESSLELSRPAPAPAQVTQSDPLAAIMGLTDDEKIALFS